MEELLKAGQWGQAVAEANALLCQPELSEAELAEANSVLAAALVAQKEYQAALGPGERALFAARRLGSADGLVRALLPLAEAYLGACLYTRAIALLQECLALTPHSDLAMGSVARICDLLGQAYEALGRYARAVENHRRAYEWGNNHEGVDKVEQYRSHLIWSCLRLGRLGEAETLLAESRAYATRHPSAMLNYLNNYANYAYLKGEHGEAIDLALELLQEGKGQPVQRAKAYYTLHLAAKALGLWREAQGMGLLARIQAQIARQPALEDEVTKSLLQFQGLPPIDDLFRQLGRYRRGRAVSS